MYQIIPILVIIGYNYALILIGLYVQYKYQKEIAKAKSLVIKMDTTKLIAIIAVVAVVAVGVVVVVGMNNNSSHDDKETIDTALAVYGNANNDTKVDQKDIDLIQEIIDGKKDKKDYPYADANNDNAVNKADIDFVKKIMDKTTDKVYIKCLDSKGKEVATEVTYPMINIVGIGTNMMPVMINSGVYKKLVGIFDYNGYDHVEAALKEMEKQGLTNFGGAGRKAIPDDIWKNFTDKDAELAAKGHGIDALFVDHSLGSAITESHREDMKAAGIAEVRLAVADPYEDISAAMLMGFLLGGDYESSARNYAEKSWNVLHDIQDKLSKMPADKKETFLGITMSYYICQNNSTFGQIAVPVMGIPYYTVNSEFAEKYAGTGSTPMSAIDALSNYAIKEKLDGKRGIENIFSNRSIDFNIGADQRNPTIIAEWEKAAGKTGFTTDQFFKDLDCYHNLFYIDNLLPGACKLAYTAACLYPEYYSMDDANKVVADFAGFCETMTGVTVDNSLFCFGYEDYVKAKGSA